MIASVATTLNAIADEEYYLTARHVAPFFIRDMNLGGLYVDYWGFTPVYGSEGNLVRWVYSPFFAPGPRYNSHASMLFLGDSVDETIALTMPAGWPPGEDYWKDLTNHEKRFVSLYPDIAFDFWQDAVTAETATSELFSTEQRKDNFCGNAFKHAYWNARMVRSRGLTWATEYGYAHENNGLPPTNLSKQMDLFNNEKGREIAINNPNATDAQLRTLILNALNATPPQLQVVCPCSGPPGPAAYCTQ